MLFLFHLSNEDKCHQCYYVTQKAFIQSCILQKYLLGFGTRMNDIKGLKRYNNEMRHNLKT